MVRTEKPVSITRIRSIGLGAFALTVLVTVGLSQSMGQEEPVRPQRPRTLLKLAIDANKRGDYETAARLYTQATAGKTELDSTQQADLEKLIEQNNTAMQSRKDGQAQLRRAEELLRQGNAPEAAGLLKAVNANQYLSVADRTTLGNLQERLRSTNKGAVASARAAQPMPPPKDGRSLLASGRTALQAGDLDNAEEFARQAKKLGGGLASWLQPWSDNPDKLLRDIQTARAKQQPSRIVSPSSPGDIKPVDYVTESKDSSPFGAVKRLFGTKKENPPPAPVIPEQVVSGPDMPGKPTPPVNPPAGGPPSDPGGSTPAARNGQARALVEQGYRALEANDVETARRFAIQARELRADLAWWERNPEKLLAEIDKHGGKIKTASPTAETSSVKSDPRSQVRQARALLSRENYDEAEKLCARAAAAKDVRWGLFEDSPEKLRIEIASARKKRDREESAKLLVDARKLFTSGRLEEAKKLAHRSQQLHGPTYSIWELGDRPTKLLADIDRAEVALRRSKGGAEKSPANAAQAAAHVKTLLAQARDLQRQGFLVEARQKVMQAQQLGVPPTSDADNPALVLASLAAACDQRVGNLVQRAVECAGNTNDPDRFRKAEADLAAARQLAGAFGQDPGRIEQKAGWLRQIQGNPSDIMQTGTQGANLQRSVGLDKLDKARLELKAGNTPVARKLAEEAFQGSYGLQDEALKMLRSIDAEEQNQTILAANRNAEAGLEAYRRRDFRLAAGILKNVDIRLLEPQHAGRIREIMATREMQPDNPPANEHRILRPTSLAQESTKSAPGRATVTDDPSAPKIPAGDEGLGNRFLAMEEIQFQALREKGLAAQRTAMDRVRAGDTEGAMQALQDHLDQLSKAQLDPERIALLRKSVDSRLQQYRTLQAQRSLENEEKQLWNISTHNEGARTRGIQKQQDEVAEQMRLYRSFLKEGKTKEALAAARRAKDLDPDLLAADAAIYTAKIQVEQEKQNRIKQVNGERFIRETNSDMGPHVHMDSPLKLNKDRTELAAKRGAYGSGYSAYRDGPAEQVIRSKLSTPISVNFKDTRLGDALETLSASANVNIVPDSAALQDAGINLDQKLDLKVDNISLKSALNLLLGKLHLTHVIKDQVLSITTEERGKGDTKVVTYSVADLVVPVLDYPVPPEYDTRAQLARHIASQSGVQNQGVSPFTGPNSMAGGQTISSPGSGHSGPHGQTFASNGQNANITRSGSNTIHDQLIDLITRSVYPGTWEGLGGKGTIQFFPLGMALVINQTQEVQEEVSALLAALRRLQDLEVAIEVKVVTVSEQFFERIGLDFDLNVRTNNGRFEEQLLTQNFQPTGRINSFAPNGFVSGLTPAGTFTPDLGIPIKATSFEFSVPPFGGFPGTLGGDGGLALGLAFLSDIQVFMFMEAAQGDRRFNVMQAPKITAFNGETASLTVGDQQFFLLGVNLLQTTSGNTFFVPQNTNLNTNTVSVSVTPVVSADRRFVRLALSQTLQTLSGQTPLVPIQIPVPQTFFGPGGAQAGGPNPEVIFQMFFQQPAFNTISITTTVNVPDGGTVLLGGLKTLSEGRNEFGPPILSKIPYISRLFRNVAWGREASSLLMMVTPRIIINEEEERIFLGLEPRIPRQ